ncbi:MAG: HD domain-containing phosphohydrolase [Acidimicrobiales bacterium]
MIAALSLATDLAIGVPLEHGLHSTLFAMRLADLLDVDDETASHTYYACLLFYVGCTAGAEAEAEIFGGDYALTTYGAPVRFGSRPEMMTGIMRAIAPPSDPMPTRAVRLAGGLPKAARAFKHQVAAFCQVAQMLTERLGLPASINPLFAYFAERWDGKGQPNGVKGEDVPLAVRILHVARDAAFQRMVGGDEHAMGVIRDRAGGAFDPAIARCLAEHGSDILALDADESTWDPVLAEEPAHRLSLESETIDVALEAMSSFADLTSRYLVGHSAGVARLAATAAQRCRLDSSDVVSIRRAALIHDIGRVAVPVRIWQKPGPLTPDDWERVRLHAYQSERVFARSPFLAKLASIATFHHERLDGSGYHRGSAAAALAPPARLLAAADAYHAMTEPRPHRAALTAAGAAEALGAEARAGRLDHDAVAAVLEAAGHAAQRVERPAGLTEREGQVIGLLARGCQTKQVARTLGISVKTADRHVQNAYRKIGVSTRAAAAVFAMEHGLVGWGELPIGGTGHHP